MRINCHTHIFNIKSILTQEAIKIMIARLDRGNFPNYIVRSIKAILEKLVDEGADYDSRKILEEIVGSVVEDDEFKFEIAELEDSYINMVVEGDVLDFATDTLHGFLERVVGKYGNENSDARERNLNDFLNFIRIGLLPSIDAVTDHLMGQMERVDDIVVALMMDITDGEEDDQELFKEQIKQTAWQAIRYPGRILPFVKVNPKRSNHLTLMKDALENKGFVGVKIYPSLGYSVTSVKMKTVFRYCNENDVPVLLHCNRGGYYKSPQTINYGHPQHFREILEEFTELKVCFGHFGGDADLCSETISSDSWTAEIISLMGQFSGRVYADISFHTTPMNGGQVEKNYFKNMSSLLGRAVTKSQILWGTDFFLVRQRLSEASHWDYFSHRLGVSKFNRISKNNPQKFLGLPVGTQEPSPPIIKYIQYLENNASKFENASPTWLAKYAKKHKATLNMYLSPLGSVWILANEFHKYCYEAFSSPTFGNELQHGVPFIEAGHIPIRKVFPRLSTASGDVLGKYIRRYTYTINTIIDSVRTGYKAGYDYQKAMKAVNTILTKKNNKKLHYLVNELEKIYKTKWEK